MLGASVHRRYIHMYGTVDNRMRFEEVSSVYEVKDAVDFFDVVAQTGWHRDIQRTLIHWMGLRDGDVVLEAGCGAGHFILQLA